MTHEEMLKRIAAGVKISNGAQTVSDVAHELSKLDVDLPWREREDVEVEVKKDIPDEQEQEQEPKSNLTRNIVVGGTLAATFLFFSKRSKSSPGLEVMTSMNLTKSFKLSEFLVSSIIPEIKSYKMSQGELKNVIRLATVLQKIRDEYGKPIFISSGGRPESLVARDGKYAGLTMVQILTEKGYSPATHSQHMDFSAADFSVENKSDLPGIFSIIVRMAQSPGYSNIITQSIIYIDDRAPSFVHLGVVSDIDTYNIKDKLLISHITYSEVDGGKKRSTKFFTYSQDLLNKLVS